MATLWMQLEHYFSTSFSSCSNLFLSLPDELIGHIVSFLSLKELANTRLVCCRLQRLVDDESFTYLWARAPLLSFCYWVSDENRAIIQRAAECGNAEALIMLAVASIYSEGAAEGTGKGTLNYSNGVRAAKLLLKAEKLNHNYPPFSWVLFRPPWSASSMCCKACVCHQIKLQADQADTVPQVHYLLGKALTFCGESDVSSFSTADVEFEHGSSLSCLYSAFELWKMKHRPRIHLDEFGVVRQLRKLTQSVPSFWEAQVELCATYSLGYYGGISRVRAFEYVRRVMQSSPCLLLQRLLQLQHGLSNYVRYILIDWVVEVASIKGFSTMTVHLAVNLIDRYLQLRKVSRSRLQLLGIAALLLSSRWTSNCILTVSEASWFTEKTYRYEDVVQMSGKLLAVLKGKIRVPIIPDYLDVVMNLTDADKRTVHMAYYLSEALLHHTVFGEYSCAHLAATCLQLARILLGFDTPWPHCAAQCTGFSVRDLRKACLILYDHCLTDKHSVTDNRFIKLQSVAQRYQSEEFCSSSEPSILSFNKLVQQLDIHCKKYQILHSISNQKILMASNLVDSSHDDKPLTSSVRSYHCGGKQHLSNSCSHNAEECKGHQLNIHTA